jgi:hypothetical protein
MERICGLAALWARSIYSKARSTRLLRSTRAGIDPWERRNGWVMQLAQTWDAPRFTLLVLWGLGGTAYENALLTAI